MRDEFAAELFGMRRRNVRIEPGLVFPDLKDDELVRWRSALEHFEAHDASLFSAGVRQLPHQGSDPTLGAWRGFDVADNVKRRIGSVLRSRRRRGGKRQHRNGQDELK